MTKARKKGMIVLVMFLIGCLIFAGAELYTDRASARYDSIKCVHDGVSDALMALLDTTTKRDGAEVKGERRLSQKLTVTTDKGILPVAGTVTKVQDAFYPGTYEIKFSKKSILTSRAIVQVIMDVKRGERVFVLVGDRDNGYTQYAEVVAQEDNKVSFATDILQDYTLSTTDIGGAQEAMADIFSSGIGNQP